MGRAARQLAGGTIVLQSLAVLHFLAKFSRSQSRPVLKTHEASSSLERMSHLSVFQREVDQTHGVSMKRLTQTRAILRALTHAVHELAVLILALGILWEVARLAFHLGG